jgi:serine beta-lactamase-like protein LACTB
VLDTSFAGKEHEATYYSEVKTDGSYVKSTVKRDRSFLLGGGGFISTKSDLVKMAQATYNKAYLSDSARETLTTY